MRRARPAPPATATYTSAVGAIVVQINWRRVHAQLVDTATRVLVVWRCTVVLVNETGACAAVLAPLHVKGAVICRATDGARAG